WPWLPLTYFTSPEVRVCAPHFPYTTPFRSLRKLFPLTVMVCKLFDPVTGLGLTLVICGVTTGAATWKPKLLDCRPPGLVMRTVRSSAEADELMALCNRLRRTQFTSHEVSVF